MKDDYAYLSKGKISDIYWIFLILEFQKSIIYSHVIILLSEYTKKSFKMSEICLAFYKMEIPADFSGFVEDLPEH